MAPRYCILRPGDTVVHPSTREYGRVVATWQDKWGDWDCYIAWVGRNKKNLIGKPPEKPYVLRYYAASLKLLDTCDGREVEYYTP